MSPQAAFRSQLINLRWVAGIAVMCVGIGAYMDNRKIHDQNDLSIVQRAENRYRLDRLEAWAVARGYVPPTMAEVEARVPELSRRGGPPDAR